MKYALVRQGFIFCFFEESFLLLFLSFPFSFFLPLAPLGFSFSNRHYLQKVFLSSPSDTCFSSKLFEILDGDREDFAFFDFFGGFIWLRRKDFRNVPSFGWLLAFPIVSSFLKRYSFWLLCLTRLHPCALSELLVFGSIAREKVPWNHFCANMEKSVSKVRQSLWEVGVF